MDEEIYKIYEQVKDDVSEEKFLERFEYYKEKNKDNPFMADKDFARLAKGDFKTEKNEPRSNKEEHAKDKISKLESGNQNMSVIGKVMNISNVKEFSTKKGKTGKLCNVNLADDTANIKVVFWTESIKLLKNFNEGDVIKINNVDVKDGFRGGLEIYMKKISTVNVLNKDDYPTFPEYKEEITSIEDIVPETYVNIIARITRIPSIRTFERSNGEEGFVTSLELQDKTGKISYTLWNNDVNLINSLELMEGDSVKILSASARERDGETSLTHFNSKIVKGDFDVPEYEDEVIKIAEAQEQKDISVIGLVTKVLDTITFNKQDGTEGKVKSIEIMDDTGSIRVTLWGHDTLLDINKGDIVKITGGNIEFDEYSSTGYRINTNWNTSFLVNPEDDPIIDILNEYKEQLRPINVSELESIEDDGIEVDVIGRIMGVDDINEFQRDDGTTGLVRSVNFADETGMVRLSFWDDKAKENYQLGDAYQIENVRTRMGMYSVDLNAGKTTRVIKLTEEQAAILPTFETLEELIYVPKKIVDLDEDDKNIRVVGRILEVNPIHEFDRDNGTKGYVRNIEIGDNTGSIRVTLWGSAADVEFEIGEAIKIENPRITFSEDHLEINVGGNSSILSPNDDELDSLPSFDDLKDIIYKVKTIEALEDDDTNVRISGEFYDSYGNKMLISKCPSCNETINTQIEDEAVCDFCGAEITEPKYLLMLPGRLKDETGDIQITFFGELVEELLEKDMETLIAIVEESGDLGSLEGLVEDLNGLNIEVIANVTFDDYNEEIRLSPKKILSKKY